MPDYMSVTDKGYPEVRAALAGLEPQMRKRMIRSGLVAAAGVIVKQAKATAPVRTGNYKRSLRVFPASYRRFGIVAAGSTAPHAHLVELGTIRGGARHVLQNAFKATVGAQFVAAMEAMRRHWGRVVAAARAAGHIR